MGRFEDRPAISAALTERPSDSPDRAGNRRVDTRILLTGAGGQVGRELQLALAPLGELVAPTRGELDLSDMASVREIVRKVRPRWIINSAAYTAVDKAESEPELALSVNAEAVAAMAGEAKMIGAALVHLSTDYVFDGTKSAPYIESDPTGPLGVYGDTKLKGEQMLAASGAGYAIFRTSWVYGATGKNFLLTILRLAREREQLNIVADQHGSPTWSRDIAAMVAEFMRQCEARSGGGEVAETVREVGGLFHASGAGETTWFEFATEIVTAAIRREPATRFAEIRPISTAEFPTPAKRPANSRLCCERLEEKLGWKMMHWRESLEKVMAEL